MKRVITVVFLALFSLAVNSQEVIFFSEGSGPTYYDQGLVDLSSLGSSLFEHTYPPGLPQYNDKVPCSSTSFKGSTSLLFSYTSSVNGNWRATIFRSGWATGDISSSDSLSFYIFSASQLPSSALPLIGVRAMNLSGSSELSSVMYRLSDYNGDIPAAQWKRIHFPLSVIRNDQLNSGLNFSSAKGIIFSQSETNNTSRNILIDELTAFKSLTLIPPVTALTATGYDSHAELTWKTPGKGFSYRIFASFDGGANYEARAETTDSIYLDFVPAKGKNTGIIYKVMTLSQGSESAPVQATAVTKDMTDDELLDMVERYTFRYFREGAHQASGMIPERSDGSVETVTSGGTGMGLMTMIAAHERGYSTSDDIKERILKILSFLETCERYHGAWSHWYSASTGQTIPFSAYDNGGDLVETSYVAQGLTALRNYFSGSDAKSVTIRDKSTALLNGIEWDWYRQNGQNVLFWHWSPDYGFQINMKIRGWNECLITYVMAASSASHGITKDVYQQGWAENGSMVHPATYYGFPVSLSPAWGGPLFWIHYSHLGLNPHGLSDQYADYWNEHVNTVKIHHAYALENPSGFAGYGDSCWGLSASDDPYGYSAHQPVSNDNGTISPTAAVSSIPYNSPDALKAIKYFYRERGKDLFGKYGFYDAFNDQLAWVKKGWLAIDQGPIVIMIENYRSGLLWNNFMMDNDVKNGLALLGFTTTGIHDQNAGSSALKIHPNPVRDRFFADLSGFSSALWIRIYRTDGTLMKFWDNIYPEKEKEFDLPSLAAGFYIMTATDGKNSQHAAILINK